MCNKEIEGTIKMIKKFRDDRDWNQFHDYKNLAISISVEANELLEHFQWISQEDAGDYVEKNKEEVGDEMADIAFYLLEMSDKMGVNLLELVARKIKKNEEKYPVEKARGVSTKYTNL